MRNSNSIAMPPSEAGHGMKFVSGEKILRHESSHSTLETSNQLICGCPIYLGWVDALKVRNSNSIAMQPSEAGHDVNLFPGVQILRHESSVEICFPECRFCVMSPLSRSADFES